MNNHPPRPAVIELNRRRGSGTQATLPSRKVIAFPVQRKKAA